MQNSVAFKLNSDDFSSDMIRRISAYFKKHNLGYKYYRTYHNAKLMSWGVYNVELAFDIDWDQNEFYAKKFVNEALGIVDSEK